MTLRRPISSTPIGMYVNRVSKSVRQSLLNAVPSSIITSDKSIRAFEYIGKNISSAENRLILGASALMSQPFIDASNKDVDENTRKISVCRTVAKIIAGTLTGYTIRKGCIKSIDAFSKLPTSVDEFGNPIKLTKLNTFFSPVTNVFENSDEYMNYKNGLGTVMALIVMMFSNFLIDAPFTKFLTNKFAKWGGVNNGDK